MKLQSLSIKNFRSHADTVLGDFEEVNWFLGQNGKGKTTILDAICLMLCGSCPGTDEAGRNADDLIRTDRQGNKKAARIELVMSVNGGKDPIRRCFPGDGPKSQLQQWISRITGCRPEMLRAITETSRFLLLPPPGQKVVLMNLVDATLSKADIAQELHGPAAGMVLNTFAHDTWGKVELDEVEKHFRARRPEVKALIQGAARPAAAPRFDYPIDIRALTKEQAQVHLEEWQRKFSEATGKLSDAKLSEGISLSDIDKLKKDLEKAESQVKKLPEQENLLAEASQDLAAYKSNGASVAGWVIAYLGSVDRDQDGGKDDKCPLCGRKWGQETRAKRLQVLDEACAETHAALTDRARLKQRQDDLGDNVRHLKEQKEIIEPTRAAIVKARTTMEKWATIGLAAAEAIHEANHQKSMIADYISWKGSEGANEAALKTAQEELAAIEKIIEAFGPKGLRMKLISSKLDTLIDLVNQAMRGFDLSMEVELEPFVIKVNGRKASMMSPSEKLRFTVVFQLALAHVSGLKLACLDGVDMFDKQNREAFHRILRDQELVDQVFITCTSKVADSELENPGIDGWAFYLVQKSEPDRSVVERL